jgi:hypothetical protein
MAASLDLGVSTARPARAHLVRLQEARGALVSADGAGVIEAVLISEGVGNLRDRNVYGAAAVRSAVSAFQGKPCFLDHPSRSEDHERPERSVRALCGAWRNLRLAQVPGDRGTPVLACLGTLKLLNTPAGEEARELARASLDAVAEGLPPLAGVSINASGVTEAALLDGLPVNRVVAIQDAFSADIVTRPARGGKFLSLRESRQQRRQRELDAVLAPLRMPSYRPGAGYADADTQRAYGAYALERITARLCESDRVERLREIAPPPRPSADDLFASVYLAESERDVIDAYAEISTPDELFDLLYRGLPAVLADAPLRESRAQRAEGANAEVIFREVYRDSGLYLPPEDDPAQIFERIYGAR